MATTKKPKSKPGPVPPTQRPANDPPEVIEPLFDVPEEGIALPARAIEGGRIEVYRFKTNAQGDAIGVPNHTLTLSPGATEDDIRAQRGGGQYLVRAKDALGRVVASVRKGFEGDPIEPATAKGPKASGGVASVQAGAGFRLAIQGLTAEQQQLWLLSQEVAEERRMESERARQADADRHSREMQRLETLTKSSMELLVTALTKRPEDGGESIARDVRAALRDAHRREDELRAKLVEMQEKVAELNVDVNSKDGDLTTKDLIMGVIENADTIGAFLKQIGFKPKGKLTARVVDAAKEAGQSGGGDGGGD